MLAVEDIVRDYHEKIEQAYKLGILHGINAQAMAQAEYDVMEFEDYGWSMEDDPR